MLICKFVRILLVNFWFNTSIAGPSVAVVKIKLGCSSLLCETGSSFELIYFCCFLVI